MKTEISLPKLVWLHLYPGLLILGLYTLLAPLLIDFGLPSLMSLMISFLIVVIPLEIGYLLRKAKNQFGKNASMKSILVNEYVERKKLLGIVIGGVLLSVLVAGLAQFIDGPIRQELFAWLPDWYLYDAEFSRYPRNVLIITAVIRILVDGIIIPFAEESYFRGYLLPRIDAKGVTVPILASVLFAIYHFWQPWNYVSLLIISAILVFPAWHFKNYKISLYIHTTINLLGAILFLLMVMK